MKVKYIGNAREVMIPRIGIINPGDEIKVSTKIGNQLVSRPDFVEVKPEPKKRRRRVTKTVEDAVVTHSTFKIEEEV